jgi:hypothetical protein
MPRTHSRRRHQVSRGTLVLLTVLFRHSTSRNAYVLRLVGNRWGPVLQTRQKRQKRAPRQAQAPSAQG